MFLVRFVHQTHQTWYFNYVFLVFYFCGILRVSLKRLTKHVCVCYVELWHLVFLLFCRLESENHTRVIMKPAAKERRPCVYGVGRHIAQFFWLWSPGRHTAYIFFGQPTYVYENVSIYNVCCLWALISLYIYMCIYIYIYRLHWL